MRTISNVFVILFLIIFDLFLIYEFTSVANAAEFGINEHKSYCYNVNCDQNIFGSNNNLGQIFILDKIFDDTSNKIFDSGFTSLEDALTLNQIFFQGNDIFSDQLDLDDLFILDNLFNNDPSGILTSNRTSLGDILILNQLFNNGRPISLNKYFGNEPSIGNLLILEHLFRPDLKKITGKRSLLNHLIFLKQLFYPGQRVAVLR